MVYLWTLELVSIPQGRQWKCIVQERIQEKIEELPQKLASKNKESRKPLESQKYMKAPSGAVHSNTKHTYILAQHLRLLEKVICSYLRRFSRTDMEISTRCPGRWRSPHMTGENQISHPKFLWLECLSFSSPVWRPLIWVCR